MDDARVHAAIWTYPPQTVYATPTKAIMVHRICIGIGSDIVLSSSLEHVEYV